MWINVVVSLHTWVKHLPSLWISVMVGYHEGGWNTVTHSSQLFEKNSTLWKLFFNSLKNFSHLFEKIFSTLWKMFKGEKLFKGEKIFKGEKYDRWKISKVKKFQRQKNFIGENFPISIIKSGLKTTNITHRVSIFQSFSKLKFSKLKIFQSWKFFKVEKLTPYGLYW